VTAAERFRLQADAWLGRLLERPAWNVVDQGGSASIAELSNPGRQFATAKVDVDDTARALALQDIGFRVVDTGLTLEADKVAPEDAGAARFARASDRAAVEAIAGSAFRYSRFHLDPALPDALANRIKAEWAGNWFQGARGDGMVVAEQPVGVVAGFLQLCWAAGDRLVIDLIAVRPESARRGLARAMIGFASARGTGDARRPSSMLVGTQSANTASVRLYESLGFRLRGARFVLHHHGRAA
jgi:ribosomal protein S18 acetylase RimI-like enzyme